MGWNPVKEAEKKAKKAIDNILKPAVSKLEKAAESAIWKLRKETWATIEKKGKDTIKSIDRHVVDKVEKEVEQISRKADDAVKEALEKLASDITKEGLKKIKALVHAAHSNMEKLSNREPKLVDAIDAVSWTMQIGPVTLVYGNFYSRAEGLSGVLDFYINSPPKLRRREILEMIESLGPDSVNLGLSFNFALVVGSKELGVGGDLSDIGNDLWLELGDLILEEIGVPE